MNLFLKKSLFNALLPHPLPNLPSRFLFVVLTSTLLFPQFSRALPTPTPVGRLFYTPEQRARLDAEKHRPAPLLESPSKNLAKPYQGILQRNHGPTIIWVDGKPQEAPRQ